MSRASSWQSCEGRQRVNYDEIAPRYDVERYRGKEVDPDFVAFLAGHIARDRPSPAMLDIGCGTGNQLVANCAHASGVRMVGLDLFLGMLRQAAAKPGRIGWVQGNGTALPFAGESFDFVTSQYSFHHVRGKPRLIREVLRVLRPGGRFVMTNIAPRQMPGWAVYRYFPAAWARDLEDFWPSEQIVACMSQMGFENVQAEHAHSQFQDDLGAFTRAARQRITSQLVAVSDAEYRAGLDRLEKELRQAAGMPAAIPSELCLLKVHSSKPPTA
jgi:ubiquinone/menaquinone biosynthesis C-methylase UbiE